MENNPRHDTSLEINTRKYAKKNSTAAEQRIKKNNHTYTQTHRPTAHCYMAEFKVFVSQARANPNPKETLLQWNSITDIGSLCHEQMPTET